MLLSLVRVADSDTCSTHTAWELVGQCSKVLGSGGRQDASGRDDGNKGPCLFTKLEVLQLKIFLQVFFKF